MAQREQSGQPTVLGLAEQKWQKRVIAQLVNGRWQITISAAEGEQILTHKNVRDLWTAMKVQRRRMEFAYRRDLRKAQQKKVG